MNLLTVTQYGAAVVIVVCLLLIRMPRQPATDMPDWWCAMVSVPLCGGVMLLVGSTLALFLLN